MKHYTFSNFLVTDENRRAFDIARAIAELKAGQQMPVLLLGDDGSGKTHLLYAIVNHLRASSSNAGLAYLTPTDFPEPVRQLIDDPTRVERASNAVLLVDQLDAIDTLDGSSTIAEELEAVVRIFIDNGHYVVLASNAHPDRIRQMPEGLAEVVNSGTAITLPPHGAEAQARLIEEKIRQEQSGALEAQRAEIEELKRQVAESAANRPQGDGDLQRRYEVAQAFGESIQRDLAKAQEELTALRAAAVATPMPIADTGDVIAELATLREQAAEAQRENENLREERSRVQNDWNKTQARANELDSEIKTLREQLQTAWHAEGKTKEVEDELATARAREAELETKLSTLATETEARIEAAAQEAAAARAESDQLRGELEETRARHDAAAQEASGLLQRAEGLVELVEANRARFRQVEETQREQIDSLEKLIEERASHSVHRDEYEKAQAEASEATANLEALRTQLEEANGRVATLQAQVEEANATIAALSAELDQERAVHTEAIAAKVQAMEATTEERDRLSVDLATLTTAHNALDTLLNETTGARDTLQQELDTLRTQFDAAQAEAAGHIAAANARAGDLEDRLGASEDALGVLRAVVQGFAGDLASFAGEMRSGAQELDDMANRLQQKEGGSYIKQTELPIEDATEEPEATEAVDEEPSLGETCATDGGFEPEPESDTPEEPVLDLDPLDAIVQQVADEAASTAHETIAEFPQPTDEPAADEDPADTWENPSNGFDSNGHASNGSTNGTVGGNGQETPAADLALPEWEGPASQAEETASKPAEEKKAPSWDDDDLGL